MFSFSSRFAIGTSAVSRLCLPSDHFQRLVANSTLSEGNCVLMIALAVCRSYPPYFVVNFLRAINSTPVPDPTRLLVRIIASK